MNLADTLNFGCLCSTLQPELLASELDRLGIAGFARDREASHPHLFSATPVFLSADDYIAIERSVAALHRVAALPGYQKWALAKAPAIACHTFGPQGAFMGYDFHMGAAGPRLIEINTNAGGAFLHAAAVRSHRGCCEPVDRLFGEPARLQGLEAAFIGMFRDEWRLQRGDAPLRTVAVVDNQPDDQYLAPEFELARRAFERDGIAAVVADPADLQWRAGRLWHAAFADDVPVDLVYNRLTDFYLGDARHAHLRTAYESEACVFTPHPRAHALHADKRNLVALSDDALLAGWNAAAADRALLKQVVPLTREVTPSIADELWARRRELFFKPAAGYGSKAAYRGDKLTRRVWSEIVAGGFVAQALVPPSERRVQVDGEQRALKLDIRAYAYDGRLLLLAARTYAGQTTNFRTSGGGFSPVAVLPAMDNAPIESCTC